MRSHNLFDCPSMTLCRDANLWNIHKVLPGLWRRVVCRDRERSQWPGRLSCSPSSTRGPINSSSKSFRCAESQNHYCHRRPRSRILSGHYHLVRGKEISRRVQYQQGEEDKQTYFSWPISYLHNIDHNYLTGCYSLVFPSAKCKCKY